MEAIELKISHLKYLNQPIIFWHHLLFFDWDNIYGIISKEAMLTLDSFNGL